MVLKHKLAKTVPFEMYFTFFLILHRRVFIHANGFLYIKM